MLIEHAAAHKVPREEAMQQPFKEAQLQHSFVEGPTLEARLIEAPEKTFNRCTALEERSTKTQHWRNA